LFLTWVQHKKVACLASQQPITKGRQTFDLERVTKGDFTEAESTFFLFTTITRMWHAAPDYLLANPCSQKMV
jgi:hypothetical protein